MTTLFGGIALFPPDPVFVTKDWHDKDPNPKKIFLSIGAYRDANAKPYVLRVVKKAEQRYQEQLLTGKENKEYDTIDGFKPFRDASVKMLLGDACPDLATVATAVTLSGTGALTTAAATLIHIVPATTPVYISDPTWANHEAVFKSSGFKTVNKYRYFDAATLGLDIKGMLADLSAAPEGAIVVLHLCGHNPTGIDPTQDQWQSILEVVKAKRLYTIFDSAYQGYASGSLDRDAFAARLWVRSGVEFVTCQSYAKNMGFYGDRLGCVSFTCRDADTATRVSALMKVKAIRPNYSCPPRRPARVGHMILTDSELRKEWEEELKGMSQRIIRMRELLHGELKRLGTPGNWDHIVNQIGMFSYTGLKKEQCQRLTKEYSVYLLDSGRISMAGLTEENAPRLAAAMHTVITSPEAASS